MKEKKEARTKEKNARGPRTAGFLYQYEESDDGSNVRTIVRVLNEQEEIEFKEEERIRKVKEDERIARQQFYASSNLILPNTPHTQNLNQNSNLNSNLNLNQSSLLTSHNILQSNLSSSNLNSNLNSNLLSSNNNLSISNISNMNNLNNSRISQQQQQQQQQQQKSSSLSVPSSREPSPLSPGKKNKRMKIEIEIAIRRIFQHCTLRISLFFFV